MIAMPLPIVFVSCSKRKSADRKSIQNNLSDTAHVELWTQDIQTLHDYLSDLIDRSKKSDFAVFILSPDDMTKSRDVEEASPRDKHSLRGRAVYWLARTRSSFLACSKGYRTKKATDLSGITLLMYATPQKVGVGVLRWELQPIKLKIVFKIADQSPPFHSTAGHCSC